MGYEDLDEAVVELAAGYEVATFQQRGLSPSTEEGGFTVAEAVADAAAVLDGLGWEAAYLVGLALLARPSGLEAALPAPGHFPWHEAPGCLLRAMHRLVATRRAGGSRDVPINATRTFRDAGQLARTGNGTVSFCDARGLCPGNHGRKARLAP
jgi:hypothetical protein